MTARPDPEITLGTPLLTSSEVCAYLHITQRTLERYAREGRINYLTLPGGDRRFEPEEVKAVLRRGGPDGDRRARMQAAGAVASGQMSAHEASEWLRERDGEAGQ